MQKSVVPKKLGFVRFPRLNPPHLRIEITVHSHVQSPLVDVDLVTWKWRKTSSLRHYGFPCLKNDFDDDDDDADDDDDGDDGDDDDGEVMIMLFQLMELNPSWRT